MGLKHQVDGNQKKTAIGSSLFAIMFAPGHIVLQDAVLSQGGQRDAAANFGT